MAEAVKVFSLIDEGDLETVKSSITQAYERAGKVAPRQRTAAQVQAAEPIDTGGIAPGETIKLPPFEDLIGVDPSVYRQIEAALNSGKQHLMFYGPPGTGKTTLARRVANYLNGRNVTLITGSADWSSQDIIGGYQPLTGGSVQFFPGVLLQNFDRPLIIDELNRCDIDKVIGPLFTVLSGHSTTLPYRVDAADSNSPQYIVLPQPKDGAMAHEYAPTPQWRLLATINSIDKASLYQMSYALSRRFGWIYVDVPQDTKAFVQTYAERVLKREIPATASASPLAEIWNAVNAVRPIGAAPIIEALNALEHLSPGANLFAEPNGELQVSYLDAVELFVLPLLDGILRAEAETIAAGIEAALGLAGDGPESARLKRRLLGGAI
jgi:MoxR-like ATPase